MFNFFPLPRELIRIILEYAMPCDEYEVIKLARLLKTIEYQLGFYSLKVPSKSSRITTIQKYLRSIRNYSTEITRLLFNSPVMPFSGLFVHDLFNRTPKNLKKLTGKNKAIQLIDRLRYLISKVQHRLSDRIKNQRYNYNMYADIMYLLEYKLRPKYFFLCDIYNQPEKSR